MKQIEDLQKRWRDSIRFRGLHAAPSLEKNGLALGAGTVLVKRNRDGALALDGKEARLLTLLAVGYGQLMKPSVLRVIRRASKHARAGDELWTLTELVARTSKITRLLPGKLSERPRESPMT